MRNGLAAVQRRVTVRLVERRAAICGYTRADQATAHDQGGANCDQRRPISGEQLHAGPPALILRDPRRYTRRHRDCAARLLLQTPPLPRATSSLISRADAQHGFLRAIRYPTRNRRAKPLFTAPTVKPIRTVPPRAASAAIVAWRGSGFRAPEGRAWPSACSSSACPPKSACHPATRSSAPRR